MGHTAKGAAGHLGADRYLAYLEHESAIMGILSAFAIAFAAFTIERTAGAEKGALRDVWFAGAHWVVTGAFAALFAALSFYRQRSHLMWLYGQITLVEIDPATFHDAEGNPGSLSDWLVEADAWDSWVLYRWGFGLMLIASIEIAEALVAAFHPEYVKHRLLDPYVPVLIVVPFLVFMTIVLRRHKYADEPFKEFFGCARNSED